jgi:hypothetical protein
MTLPLQLLPSQDQHRSEKLCQRAAAVGLRGLTHRVDRIRPPSVSERWGTDPLMGLFLWDLAPVDDPAASLAASKLAALSAA